MMVLMAVLRARRPRARWHGVASRIVGHQGRVFGWAGGCWSGPRRGCCGRGCAADGDGHIMGCASRGKGWGLVFLVKMRCNGR